MHGCSLVCSRGSCRAGAAHPGAVPQRKLHGARRVGWDGVLADVLPQQTPFLVCGTADDPFFLDRARILRSIGILIQFQVGELKKQ